MTADPLADVVSGQYQKWVYPEPIVDLPGWLAGNWQWFDPSHAQRMFWPDWGLIGPTSTSSSPAAARTRRPCSPPRTPAPASWRSTSADVLRSIYPALLDPRRDHDDEVELAAVSRRSGWYLLMAGGAPLVTMALMFLLGSDDRPALVLLTFAGLVGLAFSFWAYGEIAADVTALIAAGRPAEAIATDSRGRGVGRGIDSTRR